MQIKCPKCGKLLNIPETAAGKIVKCPCGTQLRAPGGGAKATATKPPAGQKPAAKPAAQKPAAQKPAAQKPAGQKPAGTAQRPATPAAGGGLDAGLFDELTESDLGTVAPVLSPGRQTRRSNAAAQSGPTGSITVGLIFISVINGLFGALFTFSYGYMITKIEEFSLSSTLYIGLQVTSSLGILVSAALCFVRGKGPWLANLFCGSYALGACCTEAIVIVDLAIRRGGLGPLMDSTLIKVGLALRAVILAWFIFHIVYLTLKPPRDFYGAAPDDAKQAGIPIGIGIGIGVLAGIALVVLIRQQATMF